MGFKKCFFEDHFGIYKMGPKINFIKQKHNPFYKLTITGYGKIFFWPIPLPKTFDVLILAVL